MSDSGSRIAINTAIRALGEIVGKVASIVFYIVIARKLGEDQFGDFIFGLSVSTVILSLVGLGTSELITREVSRRRSSLDDIYADTMAFKSLFTVVLLILLGLFLTIAGYPVDVRIAILLIGVGVGVELLSQVAYAVFIAYERMSYTALSLVLQRISTAVLGIVALELGAGLILASAIFAFGSVLGLASATFWLNRRVVSPNRNIRRERWMVIIRASFPLGLVSFLYTIILKADITLLSLLTGGTESNAEVGQYGAAFRLIEATMFIGWSFSAAMMPWLSRGDGDEGLSLARGYGLGAKGLLAILFPVGAFYAILATPLVDVLYGPEYHDAIVLIQILAPMAILFGWNVFVSTVLISRNMPSRFIRPALVVLVQNVAFNLVLIPLLGAEGAAISSVSSGLLLAALTARPLRQAVGAFPIIGTLTAPVLATAALAAAAAAVGIDHLILPAIAGSLAYVVAFLAVEAVFFREDFTIYRNLVARIRSRGRRPEEHVPAGSEIGL